jgi:hypothetical protein
MASTDEEKREEEEVLPSTNQLSIVTSDPGVEQTIEEVLRTIEDLDRTIEDLDRTIEVEKQKKNGTYFSPQSIVCECKHEELEQTEPIDLRRTKIQAEEIPRYSVILESVDIQSQPAYGSVRGNVVWKIAKKIVSVLLTPLTPKRRSMPVDGPSFASQGSNTSDYEKKQSDILGGGPGQVAHLLPHAPACAAYYGRTVADALGLDFNLLLPNQIQGLIHGTTSTKSKVFKKRETSTGLKHNYCNKCQLSSQKQMYDAPPYILIVPIMTLDAVKEWQGEPYKVIVLMNDTERYGKLLQYLDHSENCEEVDEALLLLKNFTFGMAQNHTLAELEKVKVPGADRALREAVKKRLTVLRAGRNEIVEKGVPFLERIKGTGTEDVKVAVCQVGKDGPDPFLLATKAAVNLFNQEKRILLPGCGTIDGSEDSSTHSGWPARFSSVKPPPIISLSNTAEEDSSQFSDLDEEE